MQLAIRLGLIGLLAAPPAVMAGADTNVSQNFEPVSTRAALASKALPFNNQTEIQRRVDQVLHQGVSLFPVRKGVMNGDLMFGVNRKGMVGVFLTPRGLN